MTCCCRGKLLPDLWSQQEIKLDWTFFQNLCNHFQIFFDENFRWNCGLSISFCMHYTNRVTTLLYTVGYHKIHRLCFSSHLLVLYTCHHKRYCWPRSQVLQKEVEVPVNSGLFSLVLLHWNWTPLQLLPMALMDWISLLHVCVHMWIWLACHWVFADR